MALVSCPECAAQISEKALACPKCGHPSPGMAAAGGASGRVDFLDSFFSVWSSPRATVRRILDHRPGYGVWALVLASAFLMGLNPAYTLAVSFYMSTPKAVALAFCEFFLLDFASFWAWCAFSHWMGKRLGGTGGFWEVVTANAWANPPYLIGQVLVLVALAPLWSAILFDPERLLALSLEKEAWKAGLKLLGGLLAVWGMVLMVVNLSEAHRFSKTRAFVITLVCIVVSLGVMLWFKGAFPEFYHHIDRWD